MSIQTGPRRAVVLAHDLESMGPQFPVMKLRSILCFTGTPEQTIAISRLMGFGTSILGAEEHVIARPLLIYCTHIRYVLAIDPKTPCGVIIGAPRSHLSPSQEVALSTALDRFPLLGTVFAGGML